MSNKSEDYHKLIGQINSIDYSSLEDSKLMEMSAGLRAEAGKGDFAESMTVRAFALAREAAKRTLGMRPYDVQLLAGLALNDGKLVEMQTGEGKTLSAVAPAYLKALAGKGVHILTFNDYLAGRDAEWMGPVYRFLGMSTGFVHEGMEPALRKTAYAADITYLTAREAGFDHLKAFLCRDPLELVQRPFNQVIIDEADSILIDEARIPLVLAGRTEEAAFTDPVRMAGIVEGFEEGHDYSIDEYERNIFLTEKGANRIESIFGCKNLYEAENLNLLVEATNALHARVLLKRDVDYIVRNGKIELVDEFTGRVALRRQWPNGLQEAIEAKEGIKPEERGTILASITLQNFIGLYPGKCGMTGTVHPSEAEFLELYGLATCKVPTNRPCIRVDESDVIYTDKEAKYNAVVAEIKKVNSTGRPILVGTANVGESDLLAGMLAEQGVACKVLNARNDALEASIIAKSGEFGAVTVSTNMAGRGTDIKLGGENCEDAERVRSLGGLYVIGTNRHESRRIDFQLRGRAGRQGDPGSSRFFTSLEDDLMKQYKLKELIPERMWPEKSDRPVEDKVIRREAERAQRIIEGQNFEIRRTLNKYSILMEQQRRMIYDLRTDILFGRSLPGIFRERLPEKYAKLVSELGELPLKKAESQALLHYINKGWADYLDFLSYTRESIHLVNMAGKIPVSEFNKTAIEGYERLMEEINDETAAALERAEIGADGMDAEKEGLKSPSSTWTYLIDDKPEQLGISVMSMAFDPFSVILMSMSMSLIALRKRFLRKADSPDVKGNNKKM
ncbi:MAG: accessory Sec system translocase SecA2 [Clostridiales bacterium]|nr:accessory Sec system translocase SecA2 [Clostridiales bacterium]